MRSAQVAPEPHAGDARPTSHLRSVSGAQVRDGRALLGWTPRDLARMANVGVFTVNQIELIEGPSRYPGLATIEATLKAKGIVFFYGDIPGVRVRRKRKK
jgi:transcriptional regulator with XRE-family HTH domain